MRAAAFLDRDGVLNIDVGYLGREDQLVWIEDAQHAVAAIRAAGYLVFVVTNQSGVARGLFSKDAVNALHATMQAQLLALGTRIDAFRYCPHHPEATVSTYRKQCRCRKPAAGLLLDLIRSFNVDTSRSFLIGDSQRDLAAARAAGLPGYLFPGGSLLTFVESLPIANMHGVKGSA